MPDDDVPAGRSAAVSIAAGGGGGPRRGGGGEHELTYSQSLNERNTFYFNRSTAGPSSGPSDPTMLPPVLELPPSMEATAGSPPRLATLSASAPASTSAVGRCDSLPTHGLEHSHTRHLPPELTNRWPPPLQLEGHVPEHAPVQGGRRAREDHAGWDADDLLLPDEHNGRSCGGEGRIRRCERAAKVVRLNFPGGARKRCAANNGAAASRTRRSVVFKVHTLLADLGGMDPGPARGDGDGDRDDAGGQEPDDMFDLDDL